MSTSFRWGIISTGRIARTFAQDVRHLDGHSISAVGSRSMASADAFATEFDVPQRFDTYEALVEARDGDAIYVATPHPMHMSNALLALESGKPVLVEKAFSMNSAQARLMVDAARGRGVFMMEAMWTRFLPHVVMIRDIVGSGRLGDIVHFEADHGKWFELDPEFRLFAPELGGGAVLDLGIYPISFASMLLGTPRRITSVVEPAFTGVDGTVSMIFGYESGAQSTLSCTSLARTATRACISGTRGRIEIEADFYAPTAFTLITRDGEAERFEMPVQGRGLHFEALEVERCVRDGATESAIMPLDETVTIMETIDRVLASD